MTTVRSTIRVLLTGLPAAGLLAACSSAPHGSGAAGTTSAGSPTGRSATAASSAVTANTPLAAGPSSLAATAVVFTDVTSAAGIDFKHENGAAGQKFLPETMGGGVAFFDYDGDGRLDLFLVNSMPWPGAAKAATPTSALYRNEGGGRFADTTAAAGLAITMYGLGATVGDYDNDGDADLFVTALGPDVLFRNDGGKFSDVTKDAGISDDDFGSSATWVDYDKDGDLDLFVGNYVQWTRESDIHCTLDGKRKSYCTPESYPGVSPRMWRNEGKGKFKDVTREAGLFKPTAKALGLTAVDYDQDGWPDLVVANDTQPNMLFRNKGDGTFSEEGVPSGIAFNENGVARGAMGIDAADYDGSGRPSLVIGNFANEPLSLYHNEGNGLFVDASPSSGIGQPTLLTLAFGCFFFDYDRDGFVDVLVANGHVESDIEKVQSLVTWAEPSQLFRNLGGGRFAETTAAVGPAMGEPKVARGAAYGDFDDDGDLDVALTTNGGRAWLLRNDGGNAHNWLAVRTRGSKSNRDGIGAQVRVSAGGRLQTGYVKAGTSYCSQSEIAVSFGLGKADKVDSLEIDWPSGRKDKWTDVPINRRVDATEAGGLEVAKTAAR